MASRIRKKVTCKFCRYYGDPAFDGNCPDCAKPLSDAPREGRQSMTDSKKTRGGVTLAEQSELKCSSCNTVVEDTQKFCTSCGVQFASSAASVSESAECLNCGKLGIVEGADSCPRCGEPVFYEASNSDDDEDDEDGEGDDQDQDDNADGDDDDQDQDDKNSKKKVLLDKGKKQEEFRSVRVLSPADEARVLIDLATQLHEEGNEDGIKRLAAHTVWGERDDDEEIADHKAVAENPPNWVPESAHEDWSRVVMTGRPRTMMGAIATFKGVFANR